MKIQKEKIKQEFWNWAKVENPRVVEDAELGDVYATQTLDHMFMGFAAAKAQAVPEGFVLVPKEPTDAMLFAASGRDIVAEHYGDENIMWPELRETWNAMLEAARGGNE